MHDYQPPKELLKNRTILVTGAGDGIGRVAAESFAAHGATVILLGRTLAKLEQVYDAIESVGGAQPAIYPMNLEGAGPQHFQELYQKLDEEFGSVEGILHNAAELKILSRIDDYDPETWFKIMQVNLNAPFLMTQACLPLMRRAKDASIIFTSDSVGRRGKAYWGAYGVSKFGLEGLMQILADEVEGNSAIRVNSVDPGPVRTNMRATAYPGEDLMKVKTAESIMTLYLWLMGADSIGTNGEAFTAEEPDRSAK
jgi:NAD(P)-dependent dehydrogenase (short-subunit alcohol dehydrogenase family)